MTLHQIIHGAVYELGSKLGGISHLFHNHHSEGSRDRDRSDIYGLGLLFESFSDEAKRVALLMELSEDLDLNLDIEEVKGTSLVEAALRAVQTILDQKKRT